MILVPILIVWTNTLNGPNQVNAKRGITLPSPLCKKGDPLTGVYNPLRFRVLSNCEIGSGVVDSITSQKSGSVWIDVAIGAKYSKLIGPGNTAHQNGLLVLEQTAGDQATVPSVGETVNFVGPLVYDTENQFNAIYPVWSITPT